MDTKTILLDVGGTFIKCADGRSVPSHSDGTREEIAGALRDSIGPMEGVRGIGAAIPGPFDYNVGRFLMKHKFAGAYGLTFRELAGVPGGIDLKFVHDVNAVLLGAIRMLGLTESNTALVTLGTGLGFSYSVKGKVQCGEGGSPLRSLWDIPTPDGGILEDRLSARGITADYARRTGKEGCTPRDIADLAFAGDPDARAVFAETGRRLGEALRPIFTELGIDTLLMGGQISRSLDLMEAPLRSALPGTGIALSPKGAVFQGIASLFD